MLKRRKRMSDFVTSTSDRKSREWADHCITCWPSNEEDVEKDEKKEEAEENEENEENEQDEERAQSETGPVTNDRPNDWKANICFARFAFNLNLNERPIEMQSDRTNASSILIRRRTS